MTSPTPARDNTRCHDQHHCPLFSSSSPRGLRTRVARRGPLSLLGRYLLTCPVCKQDFTGITCPQSNIRAGVDRDLFARGMGPQPEFYRIATCPKVRIQRLPWRL